MTTKSNNQFLPKAYMQGKIVSFEDAQVSVATHALHYGTAAFAGMRVYDDPSQLGHVRLFRPDLHIKRLSQSAKLLGQEIVPGTIRQAISKFLAANPGAEPYYMRPLVYASALGIAPRLHDVEFDLLIYGVKMGGYLSDKGVSCCFSSWTRGEDRSLPLRGKISGTYVSSALAKTEAASRGFDEAVFLNSSGKVAEGSAMNIFIVKNDTLITPSITQDILEGITRRSILEIAREQAIKTEEREVDRSELILADEAFLTGTATQIAPINKFEQYDLPASRPVTSRITNHLNEIIHKKSSVHGDWMVSFKAGT